MKKSGIIGMYFIESIPHVLISGFFHTGKLFFCFDVRRVFGSEFVAEMLDIFSSLNNKLLRIVSKSLNTMRGQITVQVVIDKKVSRCTVHYFRN